MRIALQARVTEAPGGRRTAFCDPDSGTVILKAVVALPGVVDGAVYEVTIEGIGSPDEAQSRIGHPSASVQALGGPRRVTL